LSLEKAMRMTGGSLTFSLAQQNILKLRTAEPKAHRLESPKQIKMKVTEPHAKRKVLLDTKTVAPNQIKPFGQTLL
jgi:hypothetical protein